MLNKKIYTVTIGAILFFQITNSGHAGFMKDIRQIQNHNTYVTYRTDPEHYDVAGNATRTCGKGYNPMNKRHRRNHQYRRPHFHPYVPWRPFCAK